MGRFFVKITQKTLFLVNQECPPPSQIGTSHGELMAFGSEFTKNPSPRIGTSHGRLRDCGSELTKNTPSPRIGTSHGGLWDFGSEFSKNTPSPELELVMEDLET